MWGTEYSGPEAAVKDGFRRSCMCYMRERKSDPKAVEIVENIYRDLGMHIVYMDAQPHDVHAAYVSLFLTSLLLHWQIRCLKKKEKKMPSSNLPVWF